jgi:cytochrome c oxidase assembly protein subunit 15
MMAASSTMPFDPVTPVPPRPDPGWPAPGRAGDVRTASRRAVGWWLVALAVMVWVMVGLGGATRLTGSGLSIMEWAPLSGTLPPLSQAEWQRLYDLYRTIPQYALVNQGFGIEGFKAIFWLEYLHRLWGRLIGLAFALPLLWFWWRRAIPAGLLPRLLLLGALGGLQGVIGWLMVASGFQPGSITVSPYRLVAHLSLAFLLLALLLHTALPLLWPAPPGAPRLARLSLSVALGLAVVAMLAGGFVAGIRAGLDYNSFPLMDGRLVPAGYLAPDPWWRAVTLDIATVQFNHRLAATLTLLAALAALAIAWPARAARLPALLFAVLVAAQYGLGIATLLGRVPVGLGTLHQLLAALVLAAGVVALHAMRPWPRPPE